MATAPPGQAHAAVGGNPDPPYTFYFPPAPPPPDPDKTPTKFIPRVILGLHPIERDPTSESSRLADAISGSPPTHAAVTAAKLLDDINAIEQGLLKDGTGRWHPTLYTMDTSSEVHQSAEKIRDSQQITGLFANINEAVKAKKHEKDIVRIICQIGDAVRRQLQPTGAGDDHRPQSDYGRFVRMENVKMDNDAADPEVNKVDIFVRGSKPSNGKTKNHWSNVVAFIEVKRRNWQELLETTALQCLRYARKMCQYRVVTSHIHYVTWCGNRLRLWYLDAVLFGCSRPFDTRDSLDQIEIVKILRLLCLQEHSAILTGHWDVAAQRELQIEANEAAKVTARTIQISKGLQPLYVRYGPFRTRTAVFADHVDDADQIDDFGKVKVTMVKASWVAPHLVPHELMILKHIQRKKRLRRNLPLLPIPIGLAQVPADFQRATSQKTRPRSGFPFPARAICSLVTQQHLGYPIPIDVSPPRLARLHKQFAEQLFILAKGGVHYRDVSNGNMRILRGTDDTLLIIDLGNARLGMRPRGHAPISDAEATIDGAIDDTRSATPEFLPLCSTKVKKGPKSWNMTMQDLSKSARLLLEKTGNGTDSFHEGVRNMISGSLGTLRKALKIAAVHSHRYIDDLESATYLHMWQMARRSGNTDQFSTKLTTQGEKDVFWEETGPLNTVSSPTTVCGEFRLTVLALLTCDHQTMDNFCPDASEEWKSLMRGLRETIHAAQEQLRHELESQFERDVPLSALKTALKDLPVGTDRCKEVKDIVNRLFEGRGLAKNKILPTEVNCFEECIRLLDDAARKLEDEHKQERQAVEEREQATEDEKRAKEKMKRAQREKRRAKEDKKQAVKRLREAVEEKKRAKEEKERAKKKMRQAAEEEKRADEVTQALLKRPASREEPRSSPTRKRKRRRGDSRPIP
ncbi:hypothetical protein BCV69DRAFT_130371 [Microstroma glucosiphilum]|uniref:Fungal-type protein kinase domain-containing protein n=1 Tax=Pseudomicrostroma glucosiphilum TaxID=1684307 RepID=A0A316TZL3_9BASI|nr:hypothetical protein BCV69DRAFT_130371 [Pseudomicrostroma glucosiphilum]PWN17703.1 hypothetical protein BCV69DRAFT_130371 [Pseudomicrostroma glucosiphilum]